MRRLVPACVAALVAATAWAADGPDPFAWLEQVHGARALAWVARQDAHTAAVLDGDARFAGLHAQARAIFEATDRLPKPVLRDATSVDDVWQDATHKHGTWRTTSLTEFRTGHPAWRTLLDLDALSAGAHANLFAKGQDCRPPEATRCLVSLSNGGGDAVAIREFDTQAGRFVPGGFDLSPQLQSADWIDADTLIVARDWSGHGADVARSGEPIELREIRRGQDPGRAPTLFRGEKTDALVLPEVLRDETGHVRAVVAIRSVTFDESEYSLLRQDAPPLKLAVPRRSGLAGLVDGQVILTLQEAWRGFPTGSVVSLPLEQLEQTGDATPVAVFIPGPRQAIASPDEGVATTAHHVLVSLLDNVQGAVESLAFRDGHWIGARLRLPAGETLTIASADPGSDTALLLSESLLDPTALWFADIASGQTTQVMRLPDRFDATRDAQEQRMARSPDGTMIPYVLVHPRAMHRDGTTPTLMFGYGGFQLSSLPHYDPALGKLWLDRGGAYVIANIRGGGEFGPAWHLAAIREHRQRAFDDFAAVARDLVATGVTSQRRLGIYGRSNGGLLASTSMVQHPELFRAVVIGNPLIDMRRYTHLPQGALWTAEYGDPDKQADWAFLARYSPYQNAKPGVAYPEPYITTDTEDDRVHPGHARKFAARLESFGDPVLFDEGEAGGHSDDADPEILATRWARFYMYLTQRLMD